MSFSFTSTPQDCQSPKPSKKQRSKGIRRDPRSLKKCTNERETPCWCSTKGVEQRLEALKELIPSMGNESNVTTADDLFEETADYIVLLRAKVEILKHLVELCGNGEEVNACSYN